MVELYHIAQCLSRKTTQYVGVLLRSAYCETVRKNKKYFLPKSIDKWERVVYNNECCCGSGGTGRRARLRGVWIHRTGSSPVSRTIRGWVNSSIPFLFIKSSFIKISNLYLLLMVEKRDSLCAQHTNSGRKNVRSGRFLNRPKFLAPLKSTCISECFFLLFLLSQTNEVLE